MFNKNGLTEKEVKESQKKYGTNSITGKNKNTFFNLFIETLGDPIIKILLIALAVKVIFLFRDFDYFETVGIVIAILAASLISTISEYGSNKAFERMQEESSKINIKVRREDNIVVGDIIILNEGDKVAADGILIKGKLSVDESSLNGETKEVNKISISNPDNATTENRVYRGTTIYDGAGEVLITKVGMNTLYGKIAKELTDTNESSPLKIRLNNLARIISKIGYISAILIGVAYLFSKIFILNNFSIDQINQNINFHIFISYLLEAMTLSVSVLVMSVPEGLPMMITLVLSTNSKKMLKDNVLVRKMVGIETAGSLNVLFTDKTGTLTKGKMEVISIIDGSLNEYMTLSSIPSKYQTILIDSLLYNNECTYDNTTKHIIGGNVTDKAIFSFISKPKDLNIRVIDKLPFNSKNKYSTSIIEKEGKKIKLIKGAPEKIIHYCSDYIDKQGNKKVLDKDKLLAFINSKTAEGKRAVAVSISQSIYPVESQRRSTLVGILLIKDDIRPEAKDGVSLIKSAGIKIIMVTGDSKSTANSIAKEVGIIDNPNDIILSSKELEALNDTELKKIFSNLKVVARALPEDKKRLVNISKELNYVTGMTGDGVNDSIALKKADVSFAIGSGTEVAKEASDIVILDDNIISISKAVLYGRTIFKNIRKFIIFQLAVNISAIMLALTGLAFSYEVPRLEYMKEMPKKKEESIINKYMFNEIILSGLYTLIISIIFLKLPIIKNIFETNKEMMTAFFSLFIFFAVFNAFNARTHRLNIFAKLNENKVFILIIIFIIIVQISIVYSGINIFDTEPISLKEMSLVLLLSSSIIPMDFIRKLILKKINSNISL